MTTGGSGTAEISIVVPTFNEIENVNPLIASIEKAMHGLSWEIIFVDDDSPDRTVEKVRAIAQQDPRIRCIRRIGRRGLSSACIEGMLSSTAPYLAVMDADLQHDERLLPHMLRILKDEDIEIVIGSRFAKSASIGNWNATRARISRLAATLSRLVLGVHLTDPMSGFFAVRRTTLEGLAGRLSSIGFKILLDIFASASRPLRFRELPYEFRIRHAGESKLDNRAALDFATLLIDKRLGRFVPTRLVYFTIVGGTGVGIHLLAFTSAFHGLGLGFIVSQALATGVAMIGNFTLNNLLTYRDRQLSGTAWVRGLLIFCLVCSVGAISNVGIAAYIYHDLTRWVPAVLGGVLIGTVWNYATSSFYVWNPSK